jgi:hypothetical protein
MTTKTANDEYLAPNWAVFNGHINQADARAREALGHMNPKWLKRIEKLERDGNGIMVIFHKRHEPATAAYIALVTAFVNENRRRPERDSE